MIFLFNVLLSAIAFNQPTRMQITSFGTLMIIHFHATFNIIHSSITARTFSLVKGSEVGLTRK